MQKQKEHMMQAQRSDAVRDHMLKQGVADSMYTCSKCKGKKITVHTQQTRGADEPMTEFYNCLDCGKSWKK